MSPLENPRWEHFAQELAKGKPASEAYVLAGYKANDGNAIRLKGNEKLLARVQELLARSAARAEVTVASKDHSCVDFLSGVDVGAVRADVSEGAASKVLVWFVQ